MNVERWVAKRRPVWTSLEDLLKQVDSHGIGSLSRDQLHGLGRLYRYVSADLSRARALNLGADIHAYLNNLVVKAHNQVYQRRKNRFLDFFNFFYATFPSLVRQYMPYIAAAFFLVIGGGLVCYDFARKDASFGHMEVLPGQPLISDGLYDIIERHQMWTDRLQDASPVFASLISTNNIRVCLLSFVMGLTGGLGTVFILFYNGMDFGAVVGVCQDYGLLSNIGLFVVGHGSLELPSIFISGGAGLLLGKAMLFPGQYSRADSLKMAAKPALGLFAGCIPLLLIAGTIESFISPRTDLSGQFKIAVGICAFICLLLYVFVPRRPLGKPSP